MGNFRLRNFNNIIGIKMGIALTGFILFLFLIVHVLGNLQIFLGKEIFNAYARTLHSFPLVISVARTILFFVFASHVMLVLTFRRRYLDRSYLRSTYKRRYLPVELGYFLSHYMYITGLIILFFLMVHMVQFVVIGSGDDNIHEFAVFLFSHIGVDIFYIIALFALCIHTVQGTRVFSQSLGIDHFQGNQLTKAKKIGPKLAVLVCLLSMSIPISILSGFIK